MDPAPLAALMFLLVMFMQISSLLYTPGVLVELQDPGVIKNPKATIIIKSDGLILFGANIFAESNVESLRAALKASPAGPPFALAADPNAPARLVEKVRALFAIELADGSTNLLGTDHPTVVVAVNFLGQYIYDNRVIGESDLGKELKKTLQTVTRESNQLTLLIWADKQVDFDAVTRLEHLAREVGIQDARLAERSVTPSAIPAKPDP
jgi:biopolymer transport protein ExbD